MTCCASTPARWPPPTIPPSPAPLSAGCWITTCTPRWPRAGTSAAPTPISTRCRPPTCAPALSTPGQAVTWLEAERANLHAAADYAAANELTLHAMWVPAAIASFLAVRGHWDQAIVLHQTALAAARRAGDRPGQAPARMLRSDVQ